MDQLMMMILFLMLNLLMTMMMSMNQILFVLEQVQHEVFDWYHLDQ
jgi:hypothetical protein